jgi:ABC-type multidrug transport system fused ATPase/permease subunit
MDEATANIDINTEAIIQKLIKEEFKDSTLITIAHRLNTVINSDRVLVLDFGEVKEFDTPHKLVANRTSMFSKLLKELEKEETENDS